jgi:hypothetical protein
MYEKRIYEQFSLQGSVFTLRRDRSE